MTGDAQDMLARLKLTLPARWFGDTTPVLDAVLTGWAAAWTGLYALLANVRLQTRLATASGMFLDIAASDYFGISLPRRVAEADAAYSARIRGNLLMPRGTRAGLVDALVTVTGRTPIIFEPLNAKDTGGYNANIGYNVSGGYGSRELPFQLFVNAYRPNITPISNAGGYNGGPGGYNRPGMFYADITDFSATISDAEIYATIAGVMPTASIAWTTISN